VTATLVIAKSASELGNEQNELKILSHIANAQGVGKRLIPSRHSKRATAGVRLIAKWSKSEQGSGVKG
jgi:hypothetical protein